MRLVRALALSIPVLCLSTAYASDFTTGEYLTYASGVWGNAGAVPQLSDYDNVELPNSDLVVVGDYYTMTFTSADAVVAYLPSTDSPGPLTVSLLDPLTSSSGSLGGEVLALRLNIDYSAAGLFAHPDGVPFGDLLLTDLEDFTQISPSFGAFDGWTVDEFLAYDNYALGGGITPYSYGDLQVLSYYLNNSFNGGNVDDFANDFLELPASSTGNPPSPTPEPPTWMLLLSVPLMLPLLRRGSCGPS